ncbi:ABC transporter permease subunit [Ramlibacter monticola]|uniref:ABC transporter permease subunit n=1 Tax=Ramlibacter monticola TaxID=1926872 RepID=A0A936Z407_9BURK|nr:ABC transporter permease subunit [Ramlibacter monticola]MBL0393236.1 ABC transporter permease subunit [Ramlibacter monticola]
MQKINSLVHALPAAWGRRAIIGAPFLMLILLFSLPFMVVMKISVSETEGIRYLDLARWNDGMLTLSIKFSNYIFLVTDSLYAATYWSSVKYAALNTICCLLIGYPFAYFMARSRASLRPALVMLVSLPFWTSYLLRVYAWRGLLDDAGLINNFLIWLGVIDAPIKMMHTGFSMTVGMVYTYLPFMILPLYGNLVKMDLRLLEAAKDLGATPWQTFWLITVPLSKNGIIAGAMLVFIPSVGEYVIPELLGGPSTLMIGRVLWDEFFSNNDWAMAASVAVSMVVLILIPLVIFNKYQTNSGVAARTE